ncbi:geranylgeranyl diphosphate synthase type I [Georgenia soli]|uniref:Geranylgeranyl diphosphate synthase type I n=1 Tax=Georgenia soli TaxID=638953 RepID=A0A2A9EG26_9MICO|nr:polyprenyl synthetase family protein [Georgenia soli]PFG37884.1 geranylgeranyl diphosphate synthase type I [Georgenia soli]
MQSVLTDLRDAVSTRVLAALDERTTPFADVGAPLGEFLAPARSLLGGGKRLRALLCGAGWTCASSAPLEGPVVLAGSALELFQGAALVHDDVMDDSLTRRGMPAAHRRFAGEHAERGWLGSADAYGQAGAIVLGDLLLSLSSMEMDAAQAAAGPAAGPRARRIYDAMTAEVALGQYLDIRSQAQPWEDDGEASLARALQVVRHKSARYSVEHPLVTGAALAGADDDLLAALSAVGLPLGEAFQLRDDELGVFGDPSTTGKPAGDDLREGKRTVLLAMTLQRADGADRAFVQERVGAPDLGDDEVARLQDVMRATGAVEAHERLIAERHAAGLAALEAASLPPRADALLRELADALTRRTA